MPEAALSARALGHTHGAGHAAVRALAGVNLDFEPGRFHLVMGPSGSGKTTLLTILGGLLTPDEGEVRLVGEVVSAMPEERRAALRRRHVGFVFQAFRLFRALDGIENVMVAQDLRGVRGAPARRAAVAALAAVGMAEQARRRPHELSGGEKQRVAIARALVNEPQVLFADEPTAALDGAAGGQVGQILRRLAVEQGKVVVVVSHDPRLLPLADHVVVLQDGRVVEERGGG